MVKRIFGPFPKQSVQAQREARCPGCHLLQYPQEIICTCEPLSPSRCGGVDWWHVLFDMNLNMVKKSLTIHIRINSDAFDPLCPAGLRWEFNHGCHFSPLLRLVTSPTTPSHW